jgi:hypothetical protein
MMERLFSISKVFAAGERREIVPVRSSGHYLLRVSIDNNGPFWADWWSCPPRGPATVFLDATGGASVSQQQV